jgi:hypothetical protein
MERRLRTKDRRRDIFGPIRGNLAAILLTIVVTGGVALLMWADTLPHDSPWEHLARDIGIAFIVSAIVGGTYELRARALQEHDTIEDILSATVGSLVGKEIWTEICDQILDRKMMRRRVDLHLRLFEPPETGEVPPGAMVLRVRTTYDLHGLRDSRQRNVSLRHQLDDHIRYGRYPRFVRIKVGDREATQTELAQGLFLSTVDLERAGGPPVPVMVEREEVVYVPGSYVLQMREPTAEVKLHLQQAPSDVHMSVKIVPHIDNLKVDVDDVIDRQFESMVMLPGQAIEFRFSRRADEHAQQVAALTIKGETATA